MEISTVLSLFFAMFVSLACAMEMSFNVDLTQAAGLLRLHFHDCFLQGCESRPIEQEAPPNLWVWAKASEIINDNKERGDKACCVVSCSDITDLGAHDSVSEPFGIAWYAACRKSSAILLLPTSENFVLIKLLFQGPCQPGFIFKINGMITATQNPESKKNANERLQLESFTLMGRGLTDEQVEKLLSGHCKQFKKQTSVAVMKRVVRGRTLLHLTKPKPHRGQGPEHH